MVGHPVAAGKLVIQRQPLLVKQKPLRVLPAEEISVGIGDVGRVAEVGEVVVVGVAPEEVHHEVAAEEEPLLCPRRLAVEQLPEALVEAVFKGAARDVGVDVLVGRDQLEDPLLPAPPGEDPEFAVLLRPQMGQVELQRGELFEDRAPPVGRRELHAVGVDEEAAVAAVGGERDPLLRAAAVEEPHLGRLVRVGGFLGPRVEAERWIDLDPGEPVAAHRVDVAVEGAEPRLEVGRAPRVFGEVLLQQRLDLRCGVVFRVDPEEGVDLEERRRFALDDLVAARGALQKFEVGVFGDAAEEVHHLLDDRLLWRDPVEGAGADVLAAEIHHERGEDEAVVGCAAEDQLPVADGRRAAVRRLPGLQRIFEQQEHVGRVVLHDGQQVQDLFDALAGEEGDQRADERARQDRQPQIDAAKERQHVRVAKVHHVAMDVVKTLHLLGVRSCILAFGMGGSAFSLGCRCDQRHIFNN